MSDVSAEPEPEYRRRRNIRGPVTLLILLGILGAAAWYGAKAVLENRPKPEAVVTCATTQARKDAQVKSSQVTVNVYNGGTRAGQARRIAAELRVRGFKVATVGNISEKKVIKKAEVRSKQNTPQAQLVAKQVTGTKVVKVSTHDTTVDLVIGDDLDELTAKAPTTLKITGKVITCRTATPEA
jgi:hypothetical protein